MATQTIARPVGGPAGSIRQRRDANRPSIGRQTTRAGTADVTEPARKEIPVPYTKTADYILKKFGDEPPSLVVHLHPTHFRFDQQDGNFSYTSPMRIFLTHLKQQTVPHEMLDELLQSEVPFYEGCLIVHVHDHKTGANPSQSTSSTMSGGSKSSPFSMHNWNEHVTPSPYVAFPTRNETKAQTDGIKKEGEAEGDSKDSNKENMPAPNQPASSQSKQKKEVRVIRTVLFPTSQSLNEEANILLRTPYDEGRDKKKQSNSSVPSTPLTAVPPTPIGSKGPPAKRQKMCLDSTNVHEWEAEVINRTAPPLFLEPAKDTLHMLQIMDFMKDPTQPKSAATPQKRKRTTAELAADEAQAAEDERFMLIQDERVQPSSTTAAAGSGGNGADAQAGGSKFEPTFSSFKTLENIKMRHEEMEQQKKEEADRQTMLRNQQKEAEQQRRKEEVERNAQQARAAQQREELQRQQQAAAAAQHAQNQAAQQALMAQRNAHLQNAQAHHFQSTSGAAMSPVVRNQTPGLMNSSPVMNGNPMMSQPNSAAPMSATPSNHGASAASPPRPASAISHHPNGVAMGRQVSQQTHTGSAQGTPQLNQSTPMMQQPMPAQNRNMTPQPRVNQQGSPIAGMNQATPVMMNGMPQLPQNMTTNMQNLTPQQRMQYIQWMQAMNAQQGSPQNLTPEQMQQRMQMQMAQQQRAQAQMQQNQMANNMNGNNAARPMLNQDYQARLSEQRQQQQQQQAQQQMLMQQQQQAQQQQNGAGGQGMPASSPGGNPAMAAAMRNGQMPGGAGRQPGVPGMPGIPQQVFEKCKQEWQQRMNMELQNARQTGNEANIGAIQARYRANFAPFVQSRYKQFQQQAQMRQQQQRAASGGMPQQGGQPGMQQMNGMQQNGMQQNGGMPNGGGMQAAGGAGGMSQEMYMQQMQAQLAQQQQRMLAATQAQRQQAQAQAQMQMQQMGQNGQGMGQGGFPQGMNMAQMQQMQQMRGMGRGMQ